jgi:hypothetical protein
MKQLKEPIPETNFDALDTLLKKRTGPCVSMLIPFHAALSMRRHNPDLLKGALEKASLLLECDGSPVEKKEKIRAELERFALAFDATRCGQSIGLFVAGDITRLVFFPFEVNQAVIVGDSFEIRDVLYLRQYLSPYYIMVLGDRSVKLFLAEANRLQEIKDEFFPMSDHHKHATRNNPALAVRKFRKDKDGALQARVDAIMNQAQHHFSSYLSGQAQTVVLAGTGSVVRQLKNEFTRRGIAAGTLSGNFGEDQLHLLGTKALVVCNRMRSDEMKKMVSMLERQSGKNKAKGLRKVWQAATAGKGLLLLVERDFRHPGYVLAGSDQIKLHPPKGSYKYVSDAVDDVIEKVLDKHGQVFFTEPHELAEFENIGMVLRY